MPLYHDAHQLVSKVESKDLYEGVTRSAAIRFNISKDAADRRAVCHVVFEDEDFVPMIDALMVRLKVQQSLLGKARDILNSADSDADKVVQVQGILRALR